MYLYKSTQDPFLLQLAADMFESIEHSCKTECGYATVQYYTPLSSASVFEIWMWVLFRLRTWRSTVWTTAWSRSSCRKQPSTSIWCSTKTTSFTTRAEAERQSRQQVASASLKQVREATVTSPCVKCSVVTDAFFCFLLKYIRFSSTILQRYEFSPQGLFCTSYVVVWQDNCFFDPICFGALLCCVAVTSS